MSEMIGNEVKKNFCAPARRFGIFSPFGFRARLFSFLPRPSGGSKKKKEVFFYVSQCSFGSQRENHQYRQMGFRRRHRRPLRSHRRHLYQGEKTVRRQTHRFRRHLPQSVLRSVLNQSFPRYLRRLHYPRKFRSLTHLHLRLRTRRRFAYGAHLRVI